MTATESRTGISSGVWRKDAARERALALLREGGHTDVEVAAAVGVSRPAVGKWRRAAGIPSSRSVRPPKSPRHASPTAGKAAKTPRCIVCALDLPSYDDLRRHHVEVHGVRIIRGPSEPVGALEEHLFT